MTERCLDDPATPSDRLLLYAYCASQFASIAMALNALSDAERTSRSHAFAAQQDSDTCAFMWSSTLGLDTPPDPADRMLMIQQWLAEHYDALIDMKDRLMLS